MTQNVFNDDPNAQQTQTGDSTQVNQQHAGGDGGSATPSNTNPQDNPNQPGATGDLFPEQLSRWVGEGKKYGSVDDFIKAFDNAQSFIDQLKQENASMREEMRAQERMEEILDKIGAGPNSQGTNGQSAGTPPNGTGQQGDSANVSIEEAIQKEVNRTLTERERQRTAEQNEVDASSKLVELTGDHGAAKDLLRKASQDLGVSVDYLREQAQTSPTAFYRLVSASYEKPSETNAGLSQSGARNSEAIGNQSVNRSRQQGDVRPWSHWKKLRREVSAAEYYSPSVQNAIMKSRQSMGDSFYDDR